MLKKKQSKKSLPIHKRKFGLSTREILKISVIKKRLLRCLVIRRLLSTKGDKYAHKIKCISKLIQVLIQSYVQLAFYDDSGCISSFPRRKFRMYDIPEIALRENLRFETYEQLESIIECFGIPETVELDNRSIATNHELLCVSLYRYHFPEKYDDLEAKFGCDYSRCSRIFNYFVRFMVENWGYLLTNNIDYWTDLIPTFADSIHRKIRAENLHIPNDHPNSQIFGFIDCTYNETCRPNDPWVQMGFYTKHKKIHGLKFQIIVLPNGMKFHVSHPDSARRRDAHLLSESRILQAIENMQANWEEKFRIHGDAAYGSYLCYLSSGELGNVRVTVENDIGEVKEYFKFINYERMLQLQRMQVASIFLVALLLHDMYVSLIGSTVSRFFSLLPPSLAQWTSQGKKKFNG